MRPWGSVVATFAQGLILGSMVQGIELVDGRYTGGPIDWLTPFSLLTGVALVIGQSEYEGLPALVNPEKDADDIDGLLGDLGFDVTTVPLSRIPIRRR